MRRALLYFAGWVAAVVIATGVGFAAISLVGGDVGAPIAGIAVVAPPPTTAPSSTARPTQSGHVVMASSTSGSPGAGSPASAPTASQVTEAGFVTARCLPSGPRLIGWAPQNGWSVLSVEKDDATPRVVFTDTASNVVVDVRCGERGPVFDVTTVRASPSPTLSATETPSSTPSASVSVTTSP